MLQLVNRTPFSASLSVFSDPEGIECAYAIIKSSFEFRSGGLVPAEKQAPLFATDIYWGAADQTSLRYAGEFTLSKPATDVLLIGNAIAPRENTRVAEASIKLGSLSKTLRLFGNRQWQKTDLGWEASMPEVWERMPLRWELAFGGVAPAKNDKPPIYEPRNPVGRGFYGSDERDWAGKLLPNIEDPAQLIRHPDDRPTPVCFAPVAPAWLPRCQYAGTYDEAWQKSRAPYLPQDFDRRFLLTAPTGLVAPGYLQGGEPVELGGFSKIGPIRFQLPICRLDLAFDFNGDILQQTPQLETVLIEPDMQRVQLLWRTGIQVDKQLLKLREVVVNCLEYPLKVKEAAE